MKYSFRTKVIAVFLLLVVTCMMGLNFFSSVFLRYIFIYDSRKAMISYAEEIEADMNSGSQNITSILDAMNDSYGITASVVDDGGNVFFSHRHFIDEKMQASYIGWIASYKTEKEKSSNTNYRFQQPKDNGGVVEKLIFTYETENGIYVLMTKEIKGIDQDIRVISNLLFIMSVIIVAIGTAVWCVGTRPFTRQIEKMSRITDNMAKLNFEEKINYSSSDEIGVLSKSIDRMSDELKSSIENLKADLETRKRTLRDLSHEIKTPITTIRGYTENIQYFCEDNEKVQKYCKIMLSECDEINSLINEMLMMSLLESDEYIQQTEEIETSRLSHELKIRIESEFALQNISVEFENAVLCCNSVLIERAVLNFVSNAVKYGAKDTPIEVRGKKNGDRYIFSVTNEGVEISEEERNRIWEAFYKSDKSRKRGDGHGIGLSIVNRIASTHSGGVDLKSENGKNTFIIWIPGN